MWGKNLGELEVCFGDPSSIFIIMHLCTSFWLNWWIIDYVRLCMYCVRLCLKACKLVLFVKRLIVSCGLIKWCIRMFKSYEWMWIMCGWMNWRCLIGLWNVFKVDLSLSLVFDITTHFRGILVNSYKWILSLYLHKNYSSLN